MSTNISDFNKDEKLLIKTLNEVRKSGRYKNSNFIKLISQMLSYTVFTRPTAEEALEIALKLKV